MPHIDSPLQEPHPRHASATIVTTEREYIPPKPLTRNILPRGSPHVSSFPEISASWPAKVNRIGILYPHDNAEAKPVERLVMGTDGSFAVDASGCSPNMELPAPSSTTSTPSLRQFFSGIGKY